MSETVNKGDKKVVIVTDHTESTLYTGPLLQTVDSCYENDISLEDN